MVGANYPNQGIRGTFFSIFLSKITCVVTSLNFDAADLGQFSAHFEHFATVVHGGVWGVQTPRPGRFLQTPLIFAKKFHRPPKNLGKMVKNEQILTYIFQNFRKFLKNSFDRMAPSKVKIGGPNFS